jgi:hypothetical protein
MRPVVMNPSPKRRTVGGWIAALGAVAACGCEAQVERTAVFLKISAPAGAPTPELLRVSWFDKARPLLRDERVPEKGGLAPGATPLATVMLEVPEPVVAGERRVVVRGFEGARPVLWGGVRVQVVAGQWTPVRLTLSATLVDEDHDEVPDVVDNCPGASDFDGCVGP